MQEYLYSFVLGSIIPSIVMFVIQNRLTKVSNLLEEKKKDEYNFNIIITQSLLALGENNKAMFEALKSGRTNGNLDKAICNYEEIEKKLNNYLIEKASRD